MAYTSDVNQNEVIEFLLQAKTDKKVLAKELKSIATQISQEQLGIKLGVATDTTKLKQLETSYDNIKISIDRINRSTKAYADRLYENIRTSDKWSKQFVREVESIKSPMDKLTDKLKLASDLFREGKLSADQYARSIESLQNKVDRLSTGSIYTRTTDTSGRKIYGDFSDISSKTSYKTDSGVIWKNMQADAGKAGAASAREFSKTFWGAIEGGTTFGHKLATTFQYATAGTAFYALTAAVGGFTTAIIEADKYSQMFQGVLEMNSREAGNLQQSIYAVGKEIGGTTKGISEAALMLGRAGLENQKLAEGLRVAAMAANVSGDSIENITEMLAAWQTVYPKENITHLGDMMAKIANESLLSIDGLKTATSYITASGAAAGVTADQLIELAGAWKQTGKADSIVGTEVRRLFTQIESGTDDVKKAYWAMGIDVDKVNKGLKSGIKEVQEATFRSFMEALGNYEKLPQAQKNSVDKLVANLQVLDKQTVQSGIVAGRSFKSMEEAGTKAAGSLETASAKIALSYEKMFERVIATASEGASKFEDAFTKALSGNSSLGSFNEKLNSISTSVNIVYAALGGFTGEVLAPFGTAVSGLVQTLGILVERFYTMYNSLEDIESGLGVATVALIAFGAVVIKNPFVAVAAGAIELVMTLKEILDLKDQIAGSNLKGITATASTSDITAVSKYTSGADKLKEIDRISKELEKRLNKYTSLSELSLSRATSATRNKVNNAIVILSGRLTALNNLKASIIDSTSKTTTKAEGNIKAEGAFVGTDTGKGQAAIDRNAQQNLDSYKEIIKAAEQEWFLSAGINDELNKKRYSLDTTLPALKAIAEMTIDQEKRSGEVAKVEQEIAKTKLEVLVIERGMRQAGASRIQDLQDQDELSKDLTENQKILTAYTVKEAQLQRELGDSITSNKYTQEDALDIYNKQLIKLKEQTAEQLRILEVTNSYNLQNYERTQSRLTEDLKLQTGYEKYRKDLLRESEDIANSFYLKAESGKEITELDVKQYEDRLKLIERSDYSTYVGMQIQQEMQSVLNSGLSDFFNIQSEGWLNFEKLGMSVLTSIMSKMLQMQIIDPLATAGASGIGSMISGFFTSAHGNIVGPNGKIPMYAKGGTFTNSIVSKPTMFAHGGGFGIMGEAGPESIMPLKRSKSGDLGVVAIGANSQPQQVTVQIRNESGEALSVTKSEARTDMSGMVIDIVIDAVVRNKKGMRDVIRGGR